MLEALKKNYGWSDGVMRLYTTLAEDMLYKDPMNNCIFLDNHDMDRFYSVVGEDYAQFSNGYRTTAYTKEASRIYIMAQKFS